VTITKPRPRVAAFIDGFNLFHGLLEHNPALKWLDLHKLVRMLEPYGDIVAVNYYTAPVDADRLPPSPKRCRQKTYWNALRANKVTVVPGKFEKRSRKCKVTYCSAEGPREFDVFVEKMTDVNMALDISYQPAFLKLDVVCIISGDTDLIPAIRHIKDNHPNCLRMVYIPCTETAFKYRRVDELKKLGCSVSRLREELVQDAQFPPSIPFPDTEPLTRPPEWSAQP
jgi:uncharacterized LabA/DUF88 family protein